MGEPYGNATADTRHGFLSKAPDPAIDTDRRHSLESIKYDVIRLIEGIPPGQSFGALIEPACHHPGQLSLDSPCYQADLPMFADPALDRLRSAIINSGRTGDSDHGHKCRAIALGSPSEQ